MRGNPKNRRGPYSKPLKSVEIPPCCHRGHDLTIAENVSTDGMNWRCLVCRREDVRKVAVNRPSRAARNRIVDKCIECGCGKYPDRRPRCFGCMNKQMHRGKREIPVESQLDIAVRQECMMPWERKRGGAGMDIGGQE